jgi:hypothetical protein
MAKKRKIPKRTPEEQARYDERTRLFRERIAWREAKEREMEAARARGEK